MGTGETLHRALENLVMQAVGDQENFICGNLQICAGLEAAIEGDMNVVQKQWEDRGMEQGNGVGDTEDITARGYGGGEPLEGDAEGGPQGLLTHTGEEGMEADVTSALDDTLVEMEDVDQDVEGD